MEMDIFYFTFSILQCFQYVTITIFFAYSSLILDKFCVINDIVTFVEYRFFTDVLKYWKLISFAIVTIFILSRDLGTNIVVLQRNKTE